MPGENENESKNTLKRIAELENKVKELEKSVKALLVAMQDVNDVTGRECMPTGKYFETEF